MTLALIAAIVFIVVLLIQKSNNAALKEKNRKDRETNLVGQKEIMLKWDKAISEEIDKMPPIEDYYSFFKTLYNKYQVPLFPFGLSSIEQEQQEELLKNKLTTAGESIRRITEQFGVNFTNSEKMKLIDHTVRLYSEFKDNPNFFKNILDMYYQHDRYTVRRNMPLKEQEEYPLYYRKKKEGDILTFDRWDIWSAISLQYFYFIMMLTRKELASKGIYNISWDNKDSFMQEVEKNQKRNDEYRKKYPWIFK